MSSNIAELRRQVRGLKAELQSTKVSQQELNRLLIGYLSITRRLNLPDPIDAQIVKLQEAIRYVIALRMAIIALEAATGPVGWALAGITVLGTAITTGELIGNLFYDGSRGV